MNKKTFAFISAVLIVFSLFSGFSVEPVAECQHVLTGNVLSEIIHPHNEYVICSICLVKVYTGVSRTYPHGDGSNGTCVQCGTHTYTGRTCISKGTCVCGATISASGHSLDTVQYSDAEHPHAYFKYCTLCDAKVYTSGNAVKNHGDGAWGSGTCPDCGSHTYVGQSCTSEGVCVCGDAIPILGHTLEGVRYSDAAHPHDYFEYCTVCWDKVYTGGSATKNHGDGTIGSGTCPQCGSHLFEKIHEQLSHPHLVIMQCDCGESQSVYTLDRYCAECVINEKTATEYEIESLIFTSMDGGDGLLIGLTAVLDCSVEYTNIYIEPNKNSIIDYGYPPFASTFSAVISSVTCSNMSPDLVPDLMAVSHTVVNYYDSAGVLIDTQQMALTIDNNARHDTTTFYILTTKPAYAVASANFSAEFYYPLYGYGDYTTVEVKAYFE